jgi:hypothetical protein
MVRDLCIFCTGDETVNVVWFKISYSDTIGSQADINRFLADMDVNIRSGYLGSTEHPGIGKYVIFTQIRKGTDVDKLVRELKALEVVLDVDYGISKNKIMQSVEFPLSFFGERAMITHTTSFVDIIRTLNETVPQSEGLLMLSGLNGGTHAARHFKNILTMDKYNFKDILNELFIAVGWGILDIRCDYETLSGQIFVMNSFIAEIYGETKQPVCAYMSGYFAGFLTEVFGRPMQVREVRCKSMGHDICEHIVSPAPPGAKLEHILREETT